MYGRTTDTAAEKWSAGLRTVITERVEDARRNNLSSIEIPLDDPDPWLVLATWEDQEQLVYWSGRNQDSVCIGIGTAEARRIDAPLSRRKLSRVLADVERSCEEGHRFFGGFRFDTASRQQAPEWSGFGTLQFVRPRFLFEAKHGEASLRIAVDDELDIEAEVGGWCFTPPAASNPASFRRMINQPDLLGWEKNIAEALADIRSGRYEKIVLARAADIRASGSASVAELFRKIADAATACYHVLIQPKPGTALICATPERLLRRKAAEVISEAVAGTRPRSLSSIDDARLRDELLSSDKDRREHEVVGRSIVENIRPFCPDVEIERKPSEMKLATGRHLKSIVRGTLREDIASGEIIAAIHPTPAVGGYPADLAIERLRELEPFDRGWYAGGIGWIGDREAEIAVGIRCALLSQGTPRLYSGAGIVEGSEAASEWDEIEQKLTGFLSILRPEGC